MKEELNYITQEADGSSSGSGAGDGFALALATETQIYHFREISSSAITKMTSNSAASP